LAPDTFDVSAYARQLASQWKFIGGACLIALVAAAGVTFFLPKQYTAKASIVIDAPAGNDPRASTAVSPVYIESLKTYEHFVTSDSLFQRAAQRFHLGEGTQVATESLKRRVVKVDKPRDTRLLEISVTLEDPVKAQAVAQYIAEETTNLSRTLARQTDEEMVADARRQADAARVQLDAVEKRVAEESRRQPLEALAAELDGLLSLRERQQRDYADADADAAQYAGDATRSAAARARRDEVRRQLDDVAKRIQSLEAAVAQRRVFWEGLNTERKAVRTAYDTAVSRWHDAEASLGAKGERLKIVDPGIVPQRPSSPHLMLNILGAMLIAFVASLVYLSLASNFAPRKEARPVYYDKSLR